MRSYVGSVLILGSYRQTITVIRSLGRAGYQVIVGRGKARDFAEFSRYTADAWVHPDLKEGEDDHVLALAKFLSERPDVRLVFPIGERQITYLVQRIAYIPRGVSLVMADPAVLAACFDKAGTYAIAKKRGIPVPEYRKVYSYGDLLAAVESTGYPCIVKPNHSLTPFLGLKAIIVGGPDSLRQHLPDWPQGNDFLLVQKFSTGYRHNCQFVAERGVLVSYFEQRVLRTDRLNYTGYGVDGISVTPSVQLKAYCESLVHEFFYTGVGCAQFLVDDGTGAANFLELNPRLDATCAIPYYCGYDFPHMAVELVEHRQAPSTKKITSPATYPVGKRGIWWLGDVEGAIEALWRKEIGLLGVIQWMMRFLRSAVSADFHLTWSWRDPLPTLFLCRRFASSLLRRLVQTRRAPRNGPVN